MTVPRLASNWQRALVLYDSALAVAAEVSGEPTATVLVWIANAYLWFGIYLMSTGRLTPDRIRAWWRQLLRTVDLEAR